MRTTLSRGLRTAGMALAMATGMLFLAPGTVGGQQEGEEATTLSEGPIVRHQLLYRGERHELTPAFGATLDDAFLRSYIAGVSYQYYLNNWLGVGVTLGYNLCSIGGQGACKTGLAERIEMQDRRDEELQTLSRIDWMAAPHLSLVPIAGKFGVTWFGEWSRVLNYDLHLVVGAAAIGLSNGGSAAGGLADRPDEIEKFERVAYGPVVGIGQRFFVSNWMALNVELRDYIIKRSLNAHLDDSGKEQRAAEEELENNLILSVGLNLYFPSEVLTSK